MENEIEYEDEINPVVKYEANLMCLIPNAVCIDDLIHLISMNETRQSLIYSVE